MSGSTCNYEEPRRKSSASAAIWQFMNTFGAFIIATAGGLAFAFATHMMV